MIKNNFNSTEYAFGFLANLLKVKMTNPEGFNIATIIKCSSYDDIFSTIGELYHSLKDGKIIIQNNSKESTSEIEKVITDVCKYFFLQYMKNPHCDVDKLIEEKDGKFLTAAKAVFTYEELIREGKIAFEEIWIEGGEEDA